MRPILAGALYWSIVFACAFALGVVRVLVVAPRLGETAAVLVESPLLLTVSWFASRWTVRRLAVGPGGGDRLAMGGVAFGLLMCAELGLSVFAFGRPAGDWLASLYTMPGAIGLAAQVAFGFVPFIQRVTSAR